MKATISTVIEDVLRHIGYNREIEINCADVILEFNCPQRLANFVLEMGGWGIDFKVHFTKLGLGVVTIPFAANLTKNV